MSHATSAVVYATSTHQGHVRELQCDFTANAEDPQGTLAFAVADGAGESHGAAVTARAAATHAATHAARTSDPAAGIAAARDHVDDDPGTGSATAAIVVATVAADGRVGIAWAGDCRAYYTSRAAGLTGLLTTDHTLGRELADNGSPRHIAEAFDNTLLSHVRNGQIDSCVDERLRDARRLMLCSDGLHRYVDDRTIADACDLIEQPAETVATLVAAALEAGGHDNIAVTVIDIPLGEPAVR